MPTYLKYKYFFFLISFSGRILIRGKKCRILIPDLHNSLYLKLGNSWSRVGILAFSGILAHDRGRGEGEQRRPRALRVLQPTNILLVLSILKKI